MCHGGVAETSLLLLGFGLAEARLRSQPRTGMGRRCLNRKDKGVPLLWFLLSSSSYRHGLQNVKESVGFTL